MFKKTLSRWRTFSFASCKTESRILPRIGHFLRDILKPNWKLTTEKNMDSDNAKPPNILLYCDAGEFDQLKKKVASVLNNSKYTVYRLTDSMVGSTPWKENTKLLVVSGTNYSEKTAEEFGDFFRRGGNIFAVCSDLFHRWAGGKRAISAPKTTLVHEMSYKGKDAFSRLLCDSCDSEWKGIEGSVILATVGGDKPVVISLLSDGSKAKSIHSLIHLLRDPDESAVKTEWKPLVQDSEQKRLYVLRDLLSADFCLDCSAPPVPDLTPAYLIGNTQAKEQVLSQLVKLSDGRQEVRVPGLTLALVGDEPDASPSATADYLPLRTSAESAPDFDSHRYLTELRTRHLGQVVIYTPVTTTTMNVIKGFPKMPDVVAIARIQTQGKGRGDNVWLSPEGCAMFTFPLIFPLSSELGRRPSVVQHLIGLSVVEGILSIPGCETLDVRIKWPNDIYVESMRTKIGGLIVTSTTYNGQIECIAGVGVNVNNMYPTLCLNTLLSERNLPPLKTEQVIAAIFNRLEELVTEFQKSGAQSFLQCYLSRWMHSDAEVTLQSGEKARIVDLDEYGFLRVKLMEAGGGEGRLISLQPDGNSFDLMRNLIICKHSA